MRYLFVLGLPSLRELNNRLVLLLGLALVAFSVQFASLNLFAIRTHHVEVAVTIVDILTIDDAHAIGLTSL